MDIHKIIGSKGQVEVLYPLDNEFKTLIKWMDHIVGEPISKKMGYLGKIMAIVHIKGSPNDEDLHAYIMQKDEWITHISPVICRLSAPSTLVLDGEEFIC